MDKQKICCGVFVLSFLCLFSPPLLFGQEDIRALKEELRNTREESDRRIRALEQKIEKIEDQSAQKTKELEEKVTAQSKEGPSPSQLSSAINRYLGTSTFMVTGAAGLSYIYAPQTGGINDIPRQKRQNTFVSDWEPMVLYRLNDWILFQGIMSAAFGSAGTSVDLSSAEFHIFPMDHLEIVGGLFDNPFGDWYEAQSPMWVNRFITAPLPFGVGAVVPAAEMGLQLRGGFEWGKPGQDWDYTVWAGNGPSFSRTSEGLDAVGATMSAPTPAAFARSNSKSVGARLRFYPIPVDADWGRLELGVSTYNGKWTDQSKGRWFNAWGLDFNYFVGNLQTRGEWVQSYRQMPGGLSSDNRNGGYLQLGYFLNGIDLPFLPDAVSKHVNRLEPLIRLSAVNQRATLVDDIAGATGIGMGGSRIGLVPDFGLSASPALFAPHSRELALGLDYWIAPSIVWQNEFDFEIPRRGGAFVAADGSTTRANHVRRDHVFLSQFTIGF